MADTSNLYRQLKDALQRFTDFLDKEATTPAPAIRALKPMVPQISDLLAKLTSLMNQLHDAVNATDITNMPVLQEVTPLITATVADLHKLNA